jgi:hypothetical protein
MESASSSQNVNILFLKLSFTQSLLVFSVHKNSLIWQKFGKSLFCVRSHSYSNKLDRVFLGRLLSSEMDKI